MLNTKKTRLRGMTLIEVIIAMVIIILVTIIAYVGVNTSASLLQHGKDLRDSDGAAIGEIESCINQYNPDKADTKEYKVDEVINYKRPIILKYEKEVKQVKIANLSNESIYVNDEELEIFEEKEGRHNLINAKDILIPRILDSIGRTSVAGNNIEGSISNQVIYAYSANETVLPEYMAMIFRSSEIKEKLELSSKRSKVHRMIKRDAIQSMNINLPTI